MSNVCLITPTGARPEAMELLAKYINAQTFRDELMWIIVDDCDPMTPLPDSRCAVEVLRPHWRWQRGDNTQCRCMALALKQIEDDDIAIIFEDDDAYLPDHIIDTLYELERVELVGERVSRYFNIATQRYQSISARSGRRRGNHTSLASNGVRGDALKLLRKICNAGTTTIDLDLWHSFTGKKQLTEHSNVIGIKGMPGRGGIGIGHKRGFGVLDTDNRLYRWIGNHAEIYEQFNRR